MSYESVREPSTCPNRAAAQEVVHVLTVASDGLRASSSFRCTRCGSVFEADEQGVPPELRPLFLAQNGHWELRVLGAGGDGVAPAGTPTLRGRARGGPPGYRASGRA
jgi:hypothetical protein